MAGLTVRWITASDGLTELGDAYDRMVLAAGELGPFYRAGWVERVWPYYRARLGGELAFLVAFRGREPVALAPLQLRKKDWAHARQRTLGFFGGTTDELDDWVPGFLFADSALSDREACLDAFADALEAHAVRWDLLDLRFLRETCPSRRVLRARFPKLLEVPDGLTTPRARLGTARDGGGARWTKYLASRSKRLHRMIERGEKRLEEDGLRARLVVSERVSSADAAMTEIIHRARQEHLRASGRARTSPFEDEHARATFFSLVQWAGANGHLRTYWLHIGDRPAAFVYAIHHAGTTYSWFNAIDPAFDRHHPGNLILARVLEAEITEHGTEIFDFMAGPNLTKELFATESLHHVGLVAPNPARFVARARHAWVHGAKKILAQIPSATRPE